MQALGRAAFVKRTTRMGMWHDDVWVMSVDVMAMMGLIILNEQLQAIRIMAASLDLYTLWIWWAHYAADRGLSRRFFILARDPLTHARESGIVENGHESMHVCHMAIVMILRLHRVNSYFNRVDYC